MASANLGPPRKGPPIPAGLAARRAAMAPNVKLTPKMNLSQIFPGDAPTLPGGGAAGAGLRLGRPVMDDPNPRRPPTGGTPFANFGKIVYVIFFSLLVPSISRLTYPSLEATHPGHYVSVAKPLSMHQESTFPTDRPFP